MTKTWGGRRKGSGRTPLPAGQRRDRMVGVSLTADEFNKLEAIATREHVSNSTAAYLLLSRALRRRK